MPVTIEKKTPAGQPVRPGRRPRLRLGALIGSGDRIGALVLPFVLAGVAFNIVFPEAFSVGGPPPWLQAVSAVVLAVGVAVWAWSVLLIVTKVRAGELVTTGLGHIGTALDKESAASVGRDDGLQAPGCVCSRFL